mmetsp:Transcript_12689/g.31952  ORF Transcript_12689/g.31952 Transcript_12689/m.31952 type:complete len:486 (+) Transcript_12689:121-1578(+)
MSQNLQKEKNTNNNKQLQNTSHRKFDFFRTIRQKIQLAFYQKMEANPAMTNTYEYFYDERIGEDCNDEVEDSKVFTTVLAKNNERKRIPFVYSLGRRYHPVHEYIERKEYEGSLFWWTYRYDFPEINCITTDAGWGCMLRSAQMMLSQALRIHFKSRHWKPDPSTSKAKDDEFVTSLMTWFADFPSRTESVYSLHNMCAAGVAKYELLPGDWYGPGSACYVLRDLVTLHQQKQSNVFRVHVSSEGTVYNDLVFELMTKEAAKKKKASQETEEQVVEPLHPLDPAISEQPKLDLTELEWDTSLLLLIPHRLGRDYVEEKYVKSVAQIFSLPQSVGILGGRPRGARWFYGAYADGSKVLGLDPHTVQLAPGKKENSGSGKNKLSIDLTDEYLASVHTPYPDILDLNRMDPSIALGFYCRNRKEYLDLQKALTDPSISPQVVSFVDKVPNYMASPSVNDMMLNDLDIDDAFDEPEEDELSEEEDYVLL